MATTTYSNLFRLNFNLFGGGFRVSGPALGGGADVTVTESGDSNSDFNVGEQVVVAGINDGTYRYIGTFGGGIVLLGPGGLFLATDASPSPTTPLGFFPQIGPTPVCFLPGTLIATPDGDRAIETLQPGDLVITADGAKPVRFVSRTSHQRDLLASEEGLPIRIRRGALGASGPVRDLLVSPDHAVLVDGHRVHASVLVNGTTVVTTELSEWEDDQFVQYLNIELDVHALITAEGLVVESYVDNLPRKDWDNYAAYLTLYGKDEPIQELSLPRIKFSRQLPSQLRARLEQQAASLVSVG